MARRMSLRALSSAVLFALLLSALHPQPAWADDGTPPPTDPAATETAASGEPVDEGGVDPATSGEPAPDAVEVLPPADAASEPVVEPPAVDASTEPVVAVADLLAQVPDATTVAVVDAQGAAVPLVSEQAAEILATGDPIWCPASVSTPIDNGAGCTPSQTSFANLITYLDSHEPTVDGIIWIEQGLDTSVTPLVLDGSGALNTMANYKLTLRGGWDGISGSKAITGTSEFNDRLQILSWQNDVTLSDLEFFSTAGTAALQVTTNKNITLTRVNSHDNAGRGADLDNRAGTGKVSIASSQFKTNGNTGLLIYSNGSITLANTTASGNAASYGAVLDNTSAPALAPQPITLTGVNTFDDNYYDGLFAASLGAITASDLSANRNGLSGTSGAGVALHNDNGTATSSSPGITLTGTNIFTENYSTGLVVASYGPIALNSLIANANSHGGGVNVDNHGASTALPVTLTGSSSFKYNYHDGLYVSSKGKISLNNLTANGNGDYGANIGNAAPGYSSDVSLTGAGAFHDNGDFGLFVQSFGAIKAANLSADRNGAAGYGYGVYLYNYDALSAKSVTLTGSNVFHDNVTGGLFIRSRGAVSVNNLTASGTTLGTGAELFNQNASTPQKVTLSGTNIFEDNYSYGLELQSIGAIALNNLRASGNGTGGGGLGAYILNNTSPSAQPVTLSGAGLFSDNHDTGLYVSSKGTITAANLTVRGNGGTGAYLDNNQPSAVGGMTLTGTNVFSENYYTGLSIASKGPLTLANITASDNTHGYGVYLDNTYGPTGTPQNVTLSGTNTIDDNCYDGLSVSSYGAITLGSVAASGNGIAGTSGSGISVTNSSGSIAKGLTLTGTYILVGNYDYGLYAVSRGAIKVNNLTASQNGYTGAYLDNNLGTAGVTLTGASAFRENDSYGLSVYSKGAITAANLTATDNGITDANGSGANLSNSGSLASAAITLTGTNVFSGNYSDGVTVFSMGAISLSSLTASGNLHGAGAQIYNDIGSATGGVTLSGTNVFQDNANHGLGVNSHGAISLNNLTASGNGLSGSGAGASLNNSSAFTSQSVKLTGANVFNDNYNSGLLVFSWGAITGSSLSARGNLHGSGAYLANDYGLATGGVTLTGTNLFRDNGLDGLYIFSYGAISTNNLTASGNGVSGSGLGANLYNGGAATAQTVKLTGTNTFNGNYHTGLSVGSLGAITASSLSAHRNTHGQGISLANDIGSATGGVTLTGTNAFDDNYYDGLLVSSYGAINVNALTAHRNGGSTVGYGAVLYNASAASPQTLKLTGANTFDGNYSGGLAATSRGAITVNNLTARDNSNWNGAELDNSAATTPQPITLTGTNTISDNFGHGLAIHSTGAVSATRLTADGNLMYGLYITGPAASITLTCGSFTGNGTRGIYAVTSGLLKLIGVVTSGNPLDNNFSYGSLSITRNCPLP